MGASAAHGGVMPSRSPIQVLIDVSVTPILIPGKSSLGAVSIRSAHLNRNVVVARLPEGQKGNASKVADALADMFTYADENPGEESHSRTINYIPENKGYWNLNPAR